MSCPLSRERRTAVIDNFGYGSGSGLQPCLLISGHDGVHGIVNLLLYHSAPLAKVYTSKSYFHEDRSRIR